MPACFKIRSGEREDFLPVGDKLRSHEGVRGGEEVLVEGVHVEPEREIDKQGVGSGVRLHPDGGEGEAEGSGGEAGIKNTFVGKVFHFLALLRAFLCLQVIPASKIIMIFKI